nr:protein FAR-RED IMPAIRED RESPONSE 1-like [Arachis hypogaea]
MIRSEPCNGNHGSALNASESSPSLPFHGYRASVLSSKQQRRQPPPSKASSQRSLLGNPQSVPPLAVLRLIMVQDVSGCVHAAIGHDICERGSSCVTDSITFPFSRKDHYTERFLHKEAAVAVQSFRKRASSMEFSTPEGESNSTLINSDEGNEELSVGEVVIQEESKVDEITDVIVMRKDELELRHEGQEKSFLHLERNIAAKSAILAALRFCTAIPQDTDNDKAGIRPNNVSSIGKRDFKEMMNYFVRMKEINPNFFYAIDVDDANNFRHGLPFTSFVGVNHHAKYTLLGCALLGSKEIPSFEWVFMKWVRCVGTAPRGIITDQCKAMAGAIRKVLPDTFHRWCIWHILKKSQFKLGGYARYGELNVKMNNIVWNSPSADSSEVDWGGFIKEFDLCQNRWLIGPLSLT